MKQGDVTFHALEVAPEAPQWIDSENCGRSHDQEEGPDGIKKRGFFRPVISIQKSKEDPSSKDNFDNDPKDKRLSRYERKEKRGRNEKRYKGDSKKSGVDDVFKIIFHYQMLAKKPYFYYNQSVIQSLRNKSYHWLRRSESFFKTDMVYLAKGGLWLNSVQILTALSSLGLALLFARLVPKEVYGNYRYILSLASLAAIFSLTGISSGVLQAVARGFPGTFIQAVKTLAKWNSLIFVFSIGGALYYFANDNTTLGFGLIIIAIFFPAIRTFEIYEAFLSGKKDFKRSAIYRGIVDVGTILATAISLFFTNDVLILITVNLAAQFILDGILFGKVYKSISEKEKLLVEPGIIEFSKHLSMQNVLTNFAANIDKIIIFHYLGAVQVAIYTFATAIPSQIKGFISNVVLMITPKISQRTAREASETIPGRFLISLYILVPIVALYIFFAPLIFQTLFPAYTDSVLYTRWYALVLLLMGNLSNLVLITQKAAKEQYILTTFGSSSQVILMLVLIHPFGIMGVVWSYLISKYLSALLSYILVRKLARKTLST